MNQKEQPRENRTEQAKDTVKKDRRSFFIRIFQFIIGLWTVSGLGTLVAYMRPPKGGGGYNQAWLEVASMDEVPVGRAKLIRHQEIPLLLIHPKDGVFIALSAICTHMRCLLNWDTDRSQVKCPCHRGFFDINGNVLSGPPTKPLRRYPVLARDGRIYVTFR